MDLLNVCRLCLAEKLEMYDVFSEAAEAYSFVDAVQEIAQIRIEADDQLSKNICSSCKESCAQFISFRDIILSSNDYQLRILNGEQSEQMETGLVEEIADEELPDEKGMFPFDESQGEEYLEEFQNDETADTTNDLVTSASSDESNDELTRHKCPKCSKTFTDQSKFEEHLRTHTMKVRLFPCKTCKRKFTTDIMRM